ncbi:MAG: glycerol-3-phosphate 1-O-acyltransferase PlsY [Nitrospirota bacterium]
MIIALLLISFIIGSIPTGLVVAKSKNVDLRKVGSGNIGATNVMRAVGKEAALLTLLGDMAKGALPLLIYREIAQWGYAVSAEGILPATMATSPAAIEGLLGLAAILGHDFSIFLKGKGGKGVATSLGVLLILSPYVGLFTIMIWLMTAKRTRYSSLSALVAFALLPLTFYMLDYSLEKVYVAVAMMTLILIKHRANIKRLIRGTESKIGEKTNPKF